MIAYYIHWIYPTSADDIVFYGGLDDENLFHHEENAVAYAKNYLKDILDKQAKASLLYSKIYNDEELTDEERELEPYLCGDYPCDYIIKKRDIIFKDEE